MAIEQMNDKQLLDTIYGLSSRLFYGINSKKHKEFAKNILLKYKKKCQEKVLNYSTYEVLPMENIISKENEILLFDALQSDSKSYEKETIIEFNNKVKAFVEDQLWLGCNVEIIPKEYVVHTEFDETKGKLLDITLSIGARVGEKVDKKITVLDKHHKYQPLNEISNLLENFAFKNKIKLFISVDDVDCLYYTDSR